MSEGIESRVKRAEREVHACLNYGGIFHDGGPTTQELELAYDQGDLSDEIPQMRRFAAALNELADALEADQDGDTADEGGGEGNAAVAALAYALDINTEEPMEFLACWYEGDFDAIRREWPDAPAAIFIGADPLYKPA